jgi:L-iditol 2-dehydrogenase
MKILQYNGPWQFSIENASTPEIGPEEVLMKSVSVGICGSDVHGFTGESGRRKPGMVMGHEAVGQVVAVGRNVTSFRPGQRATIFPTLGCGKCEYCARGMEHICPDKRILGVNAGRWGAMADFFSVHQRQAFLISDGIDSDLGLFAEPLGVAIHAVNLMNPAAGSTIAVVGAGTIGLALTLALLDRGVGSVYILDKIEEKLELAKEFGAVPIHVDRNVPSDFIRKKTGLTRLPGVFEAVGTAATVRTAYDLCDFGGTLVLVGNLAKEFTLPLQGVTSNETTIRGSYGFNRADFQQGVQLVTKYQKVLRRLISGTCSMEETPEIMGQMARGERNAIKMVIHP